MIWYLVVFSFYIIFLIWANVKSLKTAESVDDYTTGGHRMGLIMGIGTTAATWVSVASVVGVPGYLYSSGVAAVIGWVAGWCFGGALIPIVAYKIRRPEKPARTFPEFIRLRFEPFQKKSTLQAIVGILMFIGYLLLVNIQVTGFGIVFSSITGIDYKLAIFGFLIFILITSVGGFWSVAATDTLNTVLIAIGVLLASGVVWSLTGGLGNIVETLATTTAPTNVGGPPLDEGILLSPLGTFGFGTLFSIFISNSLGTPSSPHWVTRMLAPKNVKVAILQVMGTILVLIFIMGPLIVIGLGAKVLLPSIPAGKTTDYIIPLVIQEYTPPIVGGITLVAICAAAISTANSMLLHCATSLYYDVYLNISPKRISDRKFKNWLRISIFAIATAAVILAINPPWFLAMGFVYVYGGFGAAFFLVVFLGLYWKRMNRAGAYAGIIIGSVVYIVAKAMGNTTPFVIAVSASLIGVLLAVYFTKKAPLEAYEPYFKAEVSDSTNQVMKTIRDNSHEESQDKADHSELG
ncbi:sodium:solute symporter family protein [Halobacillus naozhouensis]|uniref:Sodium:solute symporter family protein n=1 Tax=Halobacillus naozhouensis TaxID=554880 RepID=A0ABY8IY39_9BACI|nr:sodium:solute symporter family protein [Halobacillus naozhouensis]WFT74094.1 sodium:solute symporter family protein [Halobacillus naozhouensis]